MDQKNYCPYCRSPIRKGITTCPYCGEKLDMGIPEGSVLLNEVKQRFSDRWNVLQEQGHNGIYVYYKALTRKKYRPVLLKVLNSYLLTEKEQSARFDRENKITLQLSHAHILAVEEYGQIDGFYYAIHPYMDGEYLQEKLRRKNRLEYTESIEIILQIGQALNAAHKRGFIHGQIHPQRIYCAKNGDVYLSGFYYDQKKMKTPFEPAEICPYSAPEQIIGQTVHQRSDIYGMSVLFYRLLFGELPNELKNPLKQIRYYQEKTFYDFIKSKDLQDYEMILRKGLAHEPTKRYAGAGAFMRALRNKTVVRMPACPICGTTKEIQRFTCKECGREHICQDHWNAGDICTECKENEERKKRDENLKRLKESIFLKEYIKRHRGNVEDEDLHYYLKQHGFLPINEKGLQKLVAEVKNAYKKARAKRIDAFKAAAMALITIVFIVELINILTDSSPTRVVPKKSYVFPSSTQCSYDDEDIRRRGKVNRLYNQAMEYIRKNQLTSPSGRCALSVVEELAYYDADKSNAIKIKIAQKYKDWGTINYNKGLYKRALTYFRKALQLDESDFTRKMISQLESRIQESKSRKQIKKIEMVYVQGGIFRMGCTWEQNNCDSDEKPSHMVTVNSFYIGKYEVTQAQYMAIMGKNPSYFKENNQPVEKISWYDAVRFCNKLSEYEGLEPCYRIYGRNVTCNFNKNGYRLPTEAEWEYAARGGKYRREYTCAGSNHFYAVAWYWGNSGKKTHPVGQKQPNELGLYDMSGNVWEWCWDWYGKNYYSRSPRNNPCGPNSGSGRVVRGGCWNDNAWNVRIANRSRSNPSNRYSNLGFRLLRAK